MAIRDRSDRMFGYYRGSYRCLLCWSDHRGWRSWRGHVKKAHDLSDPIFDRRA